MKDKIGQDIIPGSLIVYATAQGNSPTLKVGKVIHVKTDIKRYIHGDEYEINKITVQGIDEYKTPKLNTKLSTLDYPKRVIVINPDLLPAKYKELLDEVSE